MPRKNLHEIFSRIIKVLKYAYANIVTAIMNLTTKETFVTFMEEFHEVKIKNI